MDNHHQNPNGSTKGILLSPMQLALATAGNVLLLVIIWSLARPGQNQPAAEVETNTTTQIAATTTTSPRGAEAIIGTATINPTSPSIFPTNASLFEPSMVVISTNIDGYAKLYAYDLEEGGYIKLTHGEWDDIHPAISPEGNRIAFASNRRGYWDIYILELSNGHVQKVTEDEAYDGHPSWSPDGNWLAYETYLDDNLEIAITAIDGSTPPIMLTNNLASDHSPAWSPAGRMLAFVSDRSGSWDIWRIDLDDSSDKRIQNYTNNPTADQTNPNWSGDGSLISWSSTADGEQKVYYSKFTSGVRPAYALPGMRMLWGDGNKQVLTTYPTPESIYMAIYESGRFNLLLPPIQIPGQLDGIDWGAFTLPRPLPSVFETIGAEKLAASLTSRQAPEAGSVFGRQLTLPLVDVEAPHAELSALAVEPFFGLRDRVMEEAGWDVLSSLENAFVPITQPLEPGRSQDWLYTGRAFTLPPVYLDVGWMTAVKEDYAGKVFWRLYVRAMRQDGSQGRPLRQKPWDFNARFTTNTTHYEQGGAPLKRVPDGYWVDFTTIAQIFGWERLPALSSWEYYFHAARFNEFVITSGLEWEDAMLQLYPPEILETPGPVSR